MPRERRHNRSRRRRGRLNALYRLVAVLLVVAAATAGSIIFFRVQTVTVSGQVRYSAEEILAVSRIETEDSLILLDKDAIARRLRSELPYVESVTVRRVFPDGVIITVVESAAAAATEIDGSWWLINSAGKLLEKVASPGSHAVLTGASFSQPQPGQTAAPSEESALRFAFALDFLSAMERCGLLDGLTALDCSSTDFTAAYGGRFSLLVPSTGNFDEYLALFRRAMEEELGKNETGLFDFTHYETTGYVYFRQQN